MSRSNPRGEEVKMDQDVRKRKRDVRKRITRGGTFMESELNRLAAKLEEVELKVMVRHMK